MIRRAWHWVVSPERLAENRRREEEIVQSPYYRAFVCMMGLAVFAMLVNGWLHIL